MSKKISIEQYINFDKSIDVMVYGDGELVDYYHDCSCKDIDEILRKIRDENKDAVVEQFCSGELCTGGWIRWKID